MGVPGGGKQVNGIPSLPLDIYIYKQTITIKIYMFEDRSIRQTLDLK